MTFLLWLRLWWTNSAVCEGGPFDGELRPSDFRRITVSESGREDRFFDPWNTGTHGRPGPFDIGVYVRDGVRFVWQNREQSRDANREKVQRFLEIERIVRETAL